MLVQGRGNSDGASIAAAVAIQVGMGGNVNGLTAQTTAPMITLVEIPAVAEIVLMQTGGNDSFTNIAGLAAVQVYMGGDFILLTAQTAVPMVIFTGNPAGGEVVDMDIGRNRSQTNIAGLIAVQIGVGSDIGLLTAEAYIPMELIIRSPCISKIVNMGGSRTLGGDGGDGCSGLRLRRCLDHNGRERANPVYQCAHKGGKK